MPTEKQLPSMPRRSSFGGWIVTAIVILIVYYVLLARSILQMLRARANTVLMVFAFLALLPFPPAIVMGIVIMIIWAVHNRAA